jgi:uncharacterized protein YqeY
MRENISQAVKDAMKSGDKMRLSTLRLVQAAIKDRDIAARVDAKGQSTGLDRIDDSELLGLLQKMIKQRREAAKTYADAGRSELADKETAEIAVIEEFLPKQLSAEEAEKAVAAIIDEIGASGLKDMGRTMGALKERFAGQMDFGKASAVVKARLSG